MTNGLVLRAKEAVDKLWSTRRAAVAVSITKKELALGLLVYDALHGDALPSHPAASAAGKVLETAGGRLDKREQALKDRLNRLVKAAEREGSVLESERAAKVAAARATGEAELTAFWSEKCTSDVRWAEAPPSAATSDAVVTTSAALASAHSAASIEIPHELRRQLGAEAAAAAQAWKAECNARHDARFEDEDEDEDEERRVFLESDMLWFVQSLVSNKVFIERERDRALEQLKRVEAERDAAREAARAAEAKREKAEAEREKAEYNEAYGLAELEDEVNRLKWDHKVELAGLQGQDRKSVV